MHIISAIKIWKTIVNIYLTCCALKMPLWMVKTCWIVVVNVTILCNISPDKIWCTYSLAQLISILLLSVYVIVRVYMLALISSLFTSSLDRLLVRNFIRLNCYKIVCQTSIAVSAIDIGAKLLIIFTQTSHFTIGALDCIFVESCSWVFLSKERMLSVSTCIMRHLLRELLHLLRISFPLFVIIVWLDVLQFI